MNLAFLTPQNRKIIYWSNSRQENYCYVRCITPDLGLLLFIQIIENCSSRVEAF